MQQQSLEESIYKFQRMNVDTGVKQVVEEAAQLFAVGRHMEAGALIEKRRPWQRRPPP